VDNLRRWITLALVLVGCASTLTPQQERSVENFYACKQEVGAPTAWIETVGSDGDLYYRSFGPAEHRAIQDCMTRRGHGVIGERRSPPAPVSPAPAPPERQWMKVDKTYTNAEFRRDLGACTKGGAVDEQCMKGNGWLMVIPAATIRPQPPTGLMWAFFAESGSIPTLRMLAYASDRPSCEVTRARDMKMPPSAEWAKVTISAECSRVAIGAGSDYWVFAFSGGGAFGAVDRDWCLKLLESFRGQGQVGWFGECQPIGLGRL